MWRALGVNSMWDDTDKLAEKLAEKLMALLEAKGVFSLSAISCRGEKGEVKPWQPPSKTP